jgi:hypothetical protein
MVWPKEYEINRRLNMATSPAVQTLFLVAGYTICALIGLLGLLVLWKIAIDDIDISGLLEESNGGASMSRFQWMIFSFVFAFSLFLVIFSTTPPKFPDIPGTVLSLLGVSASSFLVSKGIQFSDPAGITAAPKIVINPRQATVRAGQTQQFKAEVAGKTDAPVKWKVTVGPGIIDASGLYTAPDAKAVQAALAAKAAAAAGAPAAGAPAAAPPSAAPPSAQLHATVQVTSDDFPDAFDQAVITIF